jgi:hypothetical protein
MVAWNTPSQSSDELPRERFFRPILQIFLTVSLSAIIPVTLFLQSEDVYGKYIYEEIYWAPSYEFGCGSCIASV